MAKVYRQQFDNNAQRGIAYVFVKANISSQWRWSNSNFEPQPQIILEFGMHYK